MSNPVRITYRHITPSEEIRQLVEGTGQRLRRRRPTVKNLQVTVGLPHRNRRKGKLFGARVELGVPGKPLVAHAHHTDPRSAVQEAFRTAERVLSDHDTRRATRRRVRHGTEAGAPSGG